MTNPSTTMIARPQRLEVLLERALSIDPEIRVEFIVMACGKDQALREELLALVAPASDRKGGPHVEKSEADSSSGKKELLPGDIVGRYRIVCLIGRGGMGSVYLAERADREFQQRVAIKIVADDAMSGRIVARLRSERQILAHLNHPNIARLLDGGATDDGLPYFAMEHVDGRRIDDYCREKRLNIAERLKLFQQVCAAVQYAHQNLIVHRDIKASNILVTEEGVPKLLDFGIAKLLDSNSMATNPELTRVHERVLSPEHASPEQVRGEQIGTVSDVYGLGVLLYELLAGSKPFNFTGLSFTQIEQAVCSETPPKPSVAAAVGSELEIPIVDAETVKQLQGDLDTIIMKAMHKEAERRYGTVGALADDVGNYLANRPITARPDSLGYRTIKFWRRNRWVVSSAAAIVIAISLLTAFYTWRLVEERNTAERERKTAQAIASYIEDVFRLADPSESRGESITVRAALDAAVARIDSELQTEPRVRADLLLSMARGYGGLGLWRESLALALKAVEQERTAFGNDHLELSNALRFVGNQYNNLMQPEPAAKSYDEAWSIRERLGRTDDEDSAILLLLTAGNLRTQNRFDEALAYLDRAQKIVDRIQARPALRADLLHSRGYTQFLVGQYAKAEENSRAAVELLPEPKGHEDMNMRDNAMDIQIQSLRKLNRFDEAEALGRSMLDEQLKRYSEESPFIARTMNNVSHMMRAKGNYTEAEGLLRRAIASFNKRLGPENLDSATSYHNLGSMLHEAGKLPEAEQMLEQALTLRRNLSGSNSAIYINTLLELATIAAERGQREKGEKFFVEAAEIGRTKLGENDPRRANVNATRGRMLTLYGDLPGGERELRAVIAKNGKVDAALIATAQHWLGEVFLRKGDPCNAREPLTQALAARRATMPAQHWMIASTENEYAAALIGCGDLANGLNLQAKSYQALIDARPADDVYLRMAREHIEGAARATQASSP